MNVHSSIILHYSALFCIRVACLLKSMNQHYMHHCHPNHAVHVRVHALCFTFWELANMEDAEPLLYKSFIAPKSSEPLLFSPPPPPPPTHSMETTDPFTVFIALPFPEYHTSNPTVCYLFRWVSFTYKYMFKLPQCLFMAW